MSTHFKFTCSYCGQHLECETGLSGRQIKCPNCQQRIVVPVELKGQPGRKGPMTKFTWDTVAPLPGVKDGENGKP